jgi:pimeloyl-ACP methyl ester carboxylesterase
VWTDSLPITLTFATGERMDEYSKPDFAVLDRPDILSLLFHPRPEMPDLNSNTDTIPLMIPVEKDIAVGACFHSAGKSAPTILFFHGNGEIVADYDNMGPLYTQLGINFLPVDYRGYGRSSGEPTISGMMRDCHAILDYVTTWLLDNHFSGPLVVMGRSLGSASALELAAQRQESFSAMILESGFAYGAPLLKLLGVLIEDANAVEEKGFQHIQKIKAFQKPVLIIHGEYDQIIPLSDGQALFEACGSKNKTFLKIAGANHNDLFFRGLSEYMSAINALCKGLKAPNRISKAT